VNPSGRIWPAPAKLNLMLHVTGRRADGYHELQTVFQLVDLCDELGFEIEQDGRIERLEGAPGVPPADDLVVRAALALRAAAGRPGLGARIRVRKRIPVGGGLGGGSSDAATTLVALNEMWRSGLNVDELAGIGAGLGADVPVFVGGRSAWAEGIGERLTPLELPPRWFVIVHPGISVPTAVVFQAAELTRNSPLITIRAFLDSGGRNDCEPVVRQRFPAVAEALDWLSRFGPARLTGTGACVFAAFDRVEDAERVAARVPDPWRSFVARGLDRSPLHAAIGREYG
jgi:4-diphosphocytidyl-2-C-methyl-D-erythritol kinase